MKNVLIGMIIAAATVFTSSTTAFADEVIMKSAKSKIVVELNLSVVNMKIDWGDGKVSRFSDGIQEDPFSQVQTFSHSYAYTKERTITISGSLISVLSLDSNELTSLDVSNCPKLTKLYCSDNQFRSLNVSRCTALGVLDVSNCTLLETLNCSDDVSINCEGCPRLQFQTPNPEGTISVNMRNSSYGNTVVTPYNFDSGFYIGGDNNFHGSNTDPHRGALYQFIKIGKVNGLSDVLKAGIPSSGWTDKAAVTPGCGYIARYRYAIRDESENSTMWKSRYLRIYVVREILEAAEYQAVLGAEIQYKE